MARKRSGNSGGGVGMSGGPRTRGFAGSEGGLHEGWGIRDRGCVGFQGGSARLQVPALQ